ncbi:hypothetical protein H5410_052738 [Solanum commersonii]|uniref:Uncharacterized protein n=1 Tax=Solanum commersonii TaxID=4109 RepID=A0A9J5X313_SOLCO|nr:hypothetical protein H5410_052738 [Solanum commersonii]
MTEAFKKLNAKVEGLLQENSKLMEQDKHVITTPNPDPSGDRLIPDTERINTERDIINPSSRRDTSGNNIIRSLSFGEEDYGEHAYYQDAQDPNEDDDSRMSFDSIALHNLDT